MRNGRARARRGASSRRTRFPRTRKSVHPRPPRRRGPISRRRSTARRRSSSRRSPYSRRRASYGRGARRPQLGMGRALITAIVAVVILAGAGYWAVQHGIRTTSVTDATTAVAGQYIYTARTANDDKIALPGVVQNHLLQDGLAHQSIELARVGYTGSVRTSYIDMTPRTGSSPQDPVLKVPSRITPAIDAKISSIETAVNSPSATAGGRALYAGLTRTDFTGAPVTIISSGIDLANPDNFRSLKWDVPASEVVASVRSAGALPAIHSPVTFVIVPTAGRQPQLEQQQKDYLKSVWTALLTAAGAPSVTFIDAEGTAAGLGTPSAPSAPTVPLPPLPPTPIAQIPGPDGVTCTVPVSYFVFGRAKLLNPGRTVRDLTPCITTALDAHSTFAIDGWTSYEGPLNAVGQPATHYAYNQVLSRARVRTIANLLVNDLGVLRSAITHLEGHGDVDQPNSDPRSPANRVVVITFHAS
jgi:hypothetical protein